MANVILLHGMWSHSETARPLRDYLEEAGHCVHAPTLPGHEENSPLSREEIGRLSLIDYVRSIEEMLDEIGLKEPPVLIGHSMGGLLAQMVAARRPIAGLCLLNSAGSSGINHIFPKPAWFFRRTLTRPFFWDRPQRPTFSEASADLFGDMPEEKAKQVYSTLVEESGRAFFELVFWWADRGRASEIGELEDTPIFIVSSGKDHVVHPSVASALAKRYPQADFQKFPENGHWVFHEPGEEQIYDAIELWISATFGRPGSFFSHVHHLLPRDAAPAPISTHRSAAARSALDESRSLRRGAGEDAPSDGGSVLPR